MKYDLVDWKLENKFEYILFYTHKSSDSLHFPLRPFCSMLLHCIILLNSIHTDNSSFKVLSFSLQFVKVERLSRSPSSSSLTDLVSGSYKITIFNEEIYVQWIKIWLQHRLSLSLAKIEFSVFCFDSFHPLLLIYFGIFNVK